MKKLELGFMAVAMLMSVDFLEFKYLIFLVFFLGFCLGIFTHAKPKSEKFESDIKAISRKSLHPP